MCVPVLAAFLGLTAGCAPPPPPAFLVAPTDPYAATRWHPPPSPTSGLKRYRPVEARADWGAPASPSDRIAPGNNQPGMAKPAGGMPGMDMPGMKDMPEMGGR